MTSEQEKAEREHCEHAYDDLGVSTRKSIIALLMRQRAAVRAECEKSIDATHAEWAYDVKKLEAEVATVSAERERFAAKLYDLEQALLGVEDANREVHALWEQAKAQLATATAERDAARAERDEQQRLHRDRQAALALEAVQAKAQLSTLRAAAERFEQWLTGVGASRTQLIMDEWYQVHRSHVDAFRAPLAQALEPAPVAPLPAGLYQKYIVTRTDGSSAPGSKHATCRYFVLDVDHDRHVPPALRAYADSCEQQYPELAHDLRELAGGPAAPRCQCQFEQGDSPCSVHPRCNDCGLECGYQVRENMLVCECGHAESLPYIQRDAPAAPQQCEMINVSPGEHGQGVEYPCKHAAMYVTQGDTHTCGACLAQLRREFSDSELDIRTVEAAAPRSVERVGVLGVHGKLLLPGCPIWDLRPERMIEGGHPLGSVAELAHEGALEDFERRQRETFDPAKVRELLRAFDECPVFFGEPHYLRRAIQAVRESATE